MRVSIHTKYVFTAYDYPHHFMSNLPRMINQIIVILVIGLILLLDIGVVYSQTAQGEIEGRPAPVFLRRCTGGSNAGNLCNENGDCPGSTCPDRNVFNISVAVQFNATTTQLNTIQNLISSGSTTIFDVTDGQAEIGEAFIYNNAFGTGTEADVLIPQSGTWWQANTGLWQVGGSIEVSMDNVASAPNLGESFAHEFVHLVFDARDEYESRAAGCGSVTGNASCPDATTIAGGQVSCLMDNGGLGTGDFSELCWGQGNSINLNDISGGNHDATNVTEQSRCRSTRSCWDQVVWSWPNTILEPVGAPNPAANGLTVHTTQFVLPDNTTRIVLVLDESGSMNMESPKRMERLKVAAKDFIALAENNTELGIVSYSDDAETTSGRVNVAISQLGTNRTTWNNAIDGLAPSGWTNIGAGLQKAMDLISTAGGVTANTFIVLMTDGINNRPSPQATADADLQSKLNDLMTLGIPVFVTCTGGDVGLASQCSEIATGTGGFYVDSSDPARLAEAFIDFHERISRRDNISSYTSWYQPVSGMHMAGGSEKIFFIEEGSESVTFTLIWQQGEFKVTMYVMDPAGTQYNGEYIPQGQFVRIKNPLPGEWKMIIDWPGEQPDNFVTRAYSRNRVSSLNGAVRHATVLPGEEIYIYAYPRSYGGSISDTSKRIIGNVIRPDGSTDVIELNDLGKMLSDGGDDIDFDGVYTGVYKKTDLKGPYQFLLHADIEGWQLSRDTEKFDTSIRSPRFMREIRLSAAVGDPNDIVEEPEDKPFEFDWCKWLFFLVLLLIIIVIWYIISQRRKPN